MMDVVFSSVESMLGESVPDSILAMDGMKACDPCHHGLACS